MPFPFYIARRYFAARKSRHVINVISWIAMGAIGVGTAGLVVVLSVFNGFSDLITDLYDAFDPDIKITALEGKVFDPALLHPDSLALIDGVARASYTLEENALVKYRDRQAIATIKGVDSNFRHTSKIESRMAEGTFTLKARGADYAVVGSNMGYTLGMNLDDIYGNLNIYVPKKGVRATTMAGEAFTNMLIRPAGVYAIQQDFDSKYILVPLSFVRDLIGEPRRVSAVEIALVPGARAAEVKAGIAALAGPGFAVRDRLEQHAFLHKIFSSEKWAIYIILGFILLIAAFSIIGSVTMLVIEKKQDIATLIAMGCTVPVIRRIFIVQGTLICLSGGLGGIVLGGIVSFLQERFHLVMISNSEAYLVHAYPVVLQAGDFVFSFLLVLLIGFGLSWLTSGQVIRAERMLPAKG